MLGTDMFDTQGIRPGDLLPGSCYFFPYMSISYTIVDIIIHEAYSK